jgi:hypothetical protein
MSIYQAVIADPLHQIELGIWGDHLWKWLIRLLELEDKMAAKVFDSRYALPLFARTQA